MGAAMAKMLCSQTAPDHGRHEVLGMDAVFPNRPRTSLGVGHGSVPKSR